MRALIGSPCRSCARPSGACGSDADTREELGIERHREQRLGCRDRRRARASHAACRRRTRTGTARAAWPPTSQRARARTSAVARSRRSRPSDRLACPSSTSKLAIGRGRRDLQRDARGALVRASAYRDRAARASGAQPPSSRGLLPVQALKSISPGLRPPVLRKAKRVASAARVGHVCASGAGSASSRRCRCRPQSARARASGVRGTRRARRASVRQSSCSGVGAPRARRRRRARRTCASKRPSAKRRRSQTRAGPSRAGAAVGGSGCRPTRVVERAVHAQRRRSSDPLHAWPSSAGRRSRPASSATTSSVVAARGAGASVGSMSARSTMRLAIQSQHAALARGRPRRRPRALPLR